MAAAIQQDLAKVGIGLPVVPIEMQGVKERWAKSFDYDAILLGLAVTDFEPSSFGNFLLSSAGTHRWHPSQDKPSTEWEARIDGLFKQQSAEPDSARCSVFGSVKATLMPSNPRPKISTEDVNASDVERAKPDRPSASTGVHSLSTAPSGHANALI